MRGDIKIPNVPGRPLTGPEKAAVLLAIVGEKTATTLAGSLEERELIMLRQGIHRMAQIEAEHVEQVYEDTRKHLSKANIVGSSRVDLQACKLEYSIVSPK